MIVFDRGVFESALIDSDAVLTLEEIYAFLEPTTSLTDAEKAIVGASLVSAYSAIKTHLHYDPVQELRTEYYPQLDLGPTGGMALWEVNSTQAYLRRGVGAGVDELQLGTIPIRSITSLRIDYDGRSGMRSGAFPDESEKTEGEDFWRNVDMLDSENNPVSRDGILRSHGLWPVTPGSVKIIYTAGYSTAELRGEDALIDASSIREVLIDETIRRTHRYMTRAKKSAGFTGPLASESMGDYSYSVNTQAATGLVGTSDLAGLTVEKLMPFMRYDLGVL
jgi:hypothetical protein